MLKWFWKSKDDDPTEDDLKKQGFNPEATKTSDSKDEPIMDFSKDYEGFLTASPEQILEILNSYECNPPPTQTSQTNNNTGTRWRIRTEAGSAKIQNRWTKSDR